MEQAAARARVSVHVPQGSALGPPVLSYLYYFFLYCWLPFGQIIPFHKKPATFGQ